MADECKISDQDGPEDLEEVMEVDKEAEKESDSDDDESSDDEGKNEKRISELNLQIEQNPYIYDSYIELMKLLREDGELDKLRATREKMSEIFPLTEDLWLDWIEDEKKFAESEAEREKVERLFQRATKDYMSVGVWLEYANFSIGDLGNSGGMEKIRDVFQQALIACGLHVTKGASLWDAYRDFENAVLGGLQPAPGRIQTKEEQEKFESQMKRITNLFKRQLSLPLKQIETTYVEYQDWITEEEDPSIKAAYNKSKEKLQQIMPMENKLEIARNGTLEIYQDYIDHELKADEPARIQCIFERALQEHCLVPDMWAQYTKYLDRQLRIPDVVLSVHERATRNCPWAVAVWLGYVRAMERFQQDHQKIKQTFDKAMNAGFTQGCDYLQLWSAYCDYLRRRINWDQDHQSELEDLRATFDKAINHLLEFFPEDGDPNCTLLQYWARIEAKFCHNMEKVRELWNQVMQAGFGNQASMWLEYFNLERAYGDHKHCRKILQRACNSVNDWPETVCETYIRFEQEEGTLEQYDIAIQRTEAQLARIQERRQKAAEKEAAIDQKKKSRQEKNATQKVDKKQFPKQQQKQQQQQQRVDKMKQNLQEPGEIRPYKRKSAPTSSPDEPPTKVQVDNEGFKVPTSPGVSPKKSQPPPGFKSKAPPPGFKGKSPPPGFNPPDEAGEKTNTKDLVAQVLAEQAALTSGGEVRHDNAKFKQTVFVSNLSYDVTEDKITEIFSKVGKITEIRLVKNIKGHSKGFAYVEFEDELPIAAALKLDRETIDGRPMYVSICDANRGSHDKFKYANEMEKNKLFIKGLPFTATKEAVTNIFSQHGKLKDVRLVTHKSGVSKGIAFVEFEDQADAAKAVLQTDGLQVGDHTISVAISNPPVRKTPLTQREPSAFTPTLGGGKKDFGVRKARTQVAMVPRSLQKQPSEAQNGSDKKASAPKIESNPSTVSSTASKTDGSKLSNDDFRKMLLRK